MYDKDDNLILVQQGQKKLAHQQRPDSLQDQIFPIALFEKKFYFDEKTPQLLHRDTRDVYAIRTFTEGVAIHCKEK